MDIYRFNEKMYKSIFICTIVLLSNYISFAQESNYNYDEEKDIYKVISNVTIETEQGNQKLSTIYETSPTILVLIYTRCYGICNPLISNLSEQIQQLDIKKDFRVLVVSFDAADRLSDMERYAQQFDLQNDARWIFVTTKQIKPLIESVNFNPKWDSTIQQFDHNALLVGLNTNGYITKKIIGIRGSNELQAMLKEINNEFIVSYPLPRKNMLFSCFTYNPTTRKSELSIGLLVMLAPALITFIIVLSLIKLGKKQRKTLVK